MPYDAQISNKMILFQKQNSCKCTEWSLRDDEKLVLEFETESALKTISEPETRIPKLQ